MPDEPLAEKNLFMMCAALNPKALTELPDAYHARTCRRDELRLWKRIHFDSPDLADAAEDDMTRYFEQVYASRADEFFHRCLFICDRHDVPIATCFGWKAYGRISTIHWFKVIPSYQGLGIGRALLSIVMRSFAAHEYPVFLHTQPGSFRAIKLYTDFGFGFLTDPIIGYRPNELAVGLPFLKARMPAHAYEQLGFAKAPADFLDAVHSSPISQF